MGACLDCMARKGLLKKALKFMKEYEYKYESGWLSLMSSCWKYINLQLGEQIYNEINILFESNMETMSAASVLMSHLYSSQQQFDKQNEIQCKMHKKNWIAKQGKAEIYVNGILHAFESGAGGGGGWNVIVAR